MVKMFLNIFTDVFILDIMTASDWFSFRSFDTFEISPNANLFLTVDWLYRCFYCYCFF